jgi:antitoxin (DNA-binding transcriptional repressor) of toxin-antitoxin stability system
VTYRELRNTPGKVFERLASGEVLELVADGDTKAVLIPVEEGDAATTLDAWRRGRAMLSLARLQSESRRNRTADLPLSEINREIKAVRKTRRARESDR